MDELRGNVGKLQMAAADATERDSDRVRGREGGREGEREREIER